MYLAEETSPSNSDAGRQQQYAVKKVSFLSGFERTVGSLVQRPWYSSSRSMFARRFLQGQQNSWPWRGRRYRS